MRIRTPLDLGLVIRDRRRKLGLSQADLAYKAGVGRQWLVAVEHGKVRAALGLVFRTLVALDLSISVDPVDRTDVDDLPDIDAVVAAAKDNEK